MPQAETSPEKGKTAEAGAPGRRRGQGQRMLLGGAWGPADLTLQLLLSFPGQEPVTEITQARLCFTSFLPGVVSRTRICSINTGGSYRRGLFPGGIGAQLLGMGACPALRCIPE